MPLPKPIKGAIKPVVPTATAVNELIRYLKNSKGVGGIKVSEGAQGLIIEFRPTAAPGGQGGGGGTVAALPSYTFTSCVNGAPMSFDIPIYKGPY